MKSKNLGAVVALGIACLTSCAAPSKTITVYMSTSTPKETNLSNQVFRGVNAYRHDRSKQELIRDPGLAALARDHAQYLLRTRGTTSNDANHQGFTRRAMKAQSTMGFRQVAENVVCCRGGNGATYVRLWSRSAPHEKTMREDIYQYTGIGTVVDRDGMVFSVQLFANRDY
ncbi:MAG: hypothetical protein RLZZ214_1543 [Verrucomicrobiota bacterium]|jgi:uncharacterized protein YkwD